MNLLGAFSLLHLCSASILLDEFASLFFDKYQRITLAMGQPRAAQLAREQMSGRSGKEWQLAVESSKDELKLWRKHLLSLLLDGEKLTKECMAVPHFATINDALHYYADGYMAHAKYHETTALELLVRLDNSKKVVETMTRDIQRSADLDPILVSARAKALQEHQDAAALLSMVGKKAIKSRSKFMKVVKFIETYPEVFVRPNNKPFEMNMDWHNASNQSIAFIDMFDMTIGKDLLPLCMNAADLKNRDPVETLLQYSPANTHGQDVARVALSLAPGAMFEAIPSALVGGRFYARPVTEGLPKQDLIPLKGETVMSESHISYMATRADQFSLLLGDKIIGFSDDLIPTILSPIINISLTFGDCLHAVRQAQQENGKEFHFIRTLLVGHALAHYIAKQDKIVVMALGNDSLVMSSSPETYSVIKSLCCSHHTALNVLGAVSLAQDGLTISDFSNQPGDHIVGSRTICAPGEDVEVDEGHMRSGTSFATPVISAAVSLLKTRHPYMANQMITRILLSSATPIILVKEITHGITSYRPLAITSVCAGQFNIGYHTTHTGEVLFVSPKILYKSRAKYGMGRLNVPAALAMADKLDHLLEKAKL